MDFLYNLDISEKEIMKMIVNNKELLFLKEDKIKDVIYMLVKHNCTQKNIKSIIVGNPFCFSREVSDMDELISSLSDLGIDNVNSLLEVNPKLLDKSFSEVQEYLKSKNEKNTANNDIEEMLKTAFV